MTKHLFTLSVDGYYEWYFYASTPLEALDGLLYVWCKWLQHKGNKHYTPTLGANLSARCQSGRVGDVDVCWPACWTLEQVGDLADEQAVAWLTKLETRKKMVEVQ